jgi:hypothetical protein
MIFKLPECRNNALSARFDERIHNVGGSLLADWPYARVASRERYKTGVEAKVSDLTNLQQTIIGVWLLRSEDESRFRLASTRYQIAGRS